MGDKQLDFQVDFSLLDLWWIGLGELHTVYENYESTPYKIHQNTIFLVQASVGQKISWCFRVTHLWTKIRCFLGLCCFKRKCPKRSEKESHPAIPPQKKTQKGNGMLLQDMIRKVTFSNFVDVHEISWQLEPSEAPWWKHHGTPTFRPRNSSLNGNYLQVEKIGEVLPQKLCIHQKSIKQHGFIVSKHVQQGVFWRFRRPFYDFNEWWRGDIWSFLDGCFGIHPFEPKVLQYQFLMLPFSKENPFRSWGRRWSCPGSNSDVPSAIFGSQRSQIRSN